MGCTGADHQLVMLLAAVCLTLAVLGATVVVSLTIKPFQKLCRA